MKELTGVDLFCGCGGMSQGLRGAGVRVVAAADANLAATQTYGANFPQARVQVADLGALDSAALFELLGVAPGEVDVLVGGPPCQGFSRNVRRSQRYLDDPRNQLVSRFLDHAVALRPRLVVMENVADMQGAFDAAYSQEVEARLRAAGYEVVSGVLRADQHGVPQRRARAFFVAARGWVPQLPTATGERLTVRDAIGDLPVLGHDAQATEHDYPSEPLGPYQACMRRGSVAVRGHHPRKLSAIMLARYQALQPGQGLRDLPAHLATKGGYSGAYGRLTWETVMPTVTRWCYHPGSGRFGHPEQHRGLTMREVARLQSFPDSFELVGSIPVQAGQLGNAVPPLLMEAVVRAALAEMPSRELSEVSVAI